MEDKNGYQKAMAVTAVASGTNCEFIIQKLKYFNREM
jgi:hypothetical protein